MKKLLIIFTILGSVYTTASFAQTETPAAVYTSFKSSFTPEQEASWSKVDNLYKADFSLEGQTTSAFYNEEGNLVASARMIIFLQLPLSLQTAFKKNFKDYTASDLFEVDTTEGTTYYVTAENSKKTLKLKSDSYGVWETYKKSSKL